MSSRIVKYIEGNNVYLKIPAVEDAELLYEGLNQESESTRLRGRQTPVSFSSVEHALQQPSRQDTYAFFICLQETDEMIGEVSLLGMESAMNRCAEFQISIHKSQYFSGGFGTEASELAIEFAFGKLNLNRIQLEVFSTNTRAIAVYEKLGFVKEGLKRQAYYLDFEYKDLVMMSLLREDYLKKHNMANT
ncbi:GNAT family N-acetyltransferase [Pontibacillus yanchengensis]|uniref:GNAT family N-acetyltransferase n=2 Tax=Pontibacillus yanchengensis TaxID=462910 RepID=A0ACC7VAU2_9BACI|nr:GNAT family protein [Pontibacillus yanchengensis]MYL35180.1 GNAT family N-acetyltransferase [Pontibacillus yanchengensis]MYL52453.1 GNAT family N-acetyltransferase [Pontibacillus yanchengensis]